MRWLLLLVLLLGCESSPKDEAGIETGDNALVRGIAFQDAERFEDAVKAYSSVCERGSSEGCVRLGIMHYHGKGTSKDRQESVRLYGIACEKDNAWGCRNLAIMYLEGTGVGQSDSEAARFYKKACEGGDSTACKNLNELPSHD